MKSQKLKEIKSVQVLRGIAAVSVVGAHVNRITELYIGKNLHFSPPIFFDWGIDLFFVLSGFIIFYVHKKDFGNKSRLKNYSLKRFFRIYPLYWLVNLLVIPLVFIFQGIGSGYERNPDVIIKSLLLFPQTHSPILFVGWTLVHEIRFYIFFGLLIWLRKNLGYMLAIILITLTILRFIINPQGNYLITEYLFSPFNLEFFLGCFGAYVLSLSKRSQKIWLLGMTTFYFIYMITFNSFLIDQRIIILGLPFAIMITLLGIYELEHRIYIPKALLLLGAASFSIYLTHYLFISLFIRLVIRAGLVDSFYLSLIMFSVLLLSVVGGCIIYIKIEKPMLSYFKSRFA